MKGQKRSRALLMTALTVAISTVAADIAVAQQQAQEINVTGSRIRSSGMVTPTPVTAVDAGELQSMAPGNMIESLSQLPQFMNNEQPQTQFNFGGSAGASNLNLRGIGAQRTLVLLNGRRVVPSSRQNTVDINLFPDAMMRTVETVTGGASAAYGTDAVAGVVNFVLDTDFTGVEAHVQGGRTGRGDAENTEYSFNFGTAIGEKSHLLFSVGGFRQDGIDNYEGRDWNQGWGTVTNPAWQQAVSAGDCTLNEFCAAGPQLVRAPNVVATGYTFGGMINAPGTSLHNLQFMNDGTARPFQFSGLASLVGSPYSTNSQSISPAYGGGSGDNFMFDRGGEGGLIPEINRDNAFIYLDHQLTDNTKVFAQGIYGKSRTNSPGFSSLQFGAWAPTVYSDNAFLPQNVRDVMVAEGIDSFQLNSLRSSADLGQARFENETRMMSGTVGFETDFVGGALDGWTLEGNYQYGETDIDIRMMDFPRVDRIFAAMDAVVDPSTGGIVCNAALTNSDYRNCVPLNMFGAGRATPEAINYALGRDDGTNLKRQNAVIDQHVADFVLSGDLHEGWGAGPIGAAFGAHYREDSIRQRISDPTNPANDQSLSIVPGMDALRGMPVAFAGTATGYQFSGAENFDGTIRVKEAFAEFLIPLVSDLPLVQQLNSSLAARYADYSGSGGIWAYKYGLDWEVTDEVRVRATGSRDVRAGSLSERFDRQRQGGSVNDPAQNGDLVEFSQIIGGNPNIQPEEADTYTAGVVYQPFWMEGLQISADWYRIQTNGLIGQLQLNQIVNLCYEGVEAQCANVTRNADGDITSVFNGFQNLGRSIVSGADIEIAYRREVNWLPAIGNGGESIMFRSFYSYLHENSIDTDVNNPFTPSFESRAGGIGVGLPRNRITGNFTYMNGPLRAFIQGRWIGGGRHSHLAPQGNVRAIEGIHINDNDVASVFYTDLNVSWTIDHSSGSSIELYGNVTNLFDRAPPVHGSFFQFFGSTQEIQQLHDILGRRFVVGARMRY